jgi:hypothetical protein
MCILSVALLYSGCYSTDTISRNEITLDEEYDIVGVTTTAGYHYALKDGSGRIGPPKDSCIVGILEDGRVVTVPLTQVQSVKVSSLNTTIIIISILVVALAAIGVSGTTSGWN